MQIPEGCGDPDGLNIELGDEDGEPDVLGDEHDDDGVQGEGHRSASAQDDAAAYRFHSKSVRIQS